MIDLINISSMESAEIVQSSMKSETEEGNFMKLFSDEK